MKRRGAKLVPVRFSPNVPDGGAEGWGRFTRLAANGGELLTRFRLQKGDRLVLDFELTGERFGAFPAQVARAATDIDGYYAAELRFLGPSSQVRLGRVLRDLLARVP